MEFPRESVRRFGEYLALLLTTQYDYDTIDRIAKARDKSDLLEGMYRALRQAERVKSDVERVREVLSEEERAGLDVRVPSADDAERISSYASSSPGKVKEVALHMACLALAWYPSADRIKRGLERLAGGS